MERAQGTTGREAASHGADRGRGAGGGSSPPRMARMLHRKATMSRLRSDQTPSRSWLLGRWALLALLVGVGACEDPRLPLQYLRNAASPAEELAAAESRGPGLMEDLPEPVRVDWDSITARDTLRVLLSFNSTGYFIYRGEPMGYEYDLLEAFAEAHELEMSTQVVPERRDLFRKLNQGDGDVVAARLVRRPDYQDEVALTRSLYDTRPVVVQRDPAAPLPDPVVDTTDSAAVTPLSLGDPVAVPARLLSNPSQLAGQEVYVPPTSDFYDRVVELSDSLGDPIEVVEVENAEEVEPLIEAVARGQIRLTVSHENLARLSTARFTNLRATPVLGDPEGVAWAVRTTSPTLRARIDAWLASEEGQRLNAILYNKYFSDREGYQERLADEFLVASPKGSISAYDSLLKQFAEEADWDWRLLAAQVAQESRFDPQARSWVGATGLLQLMPRTAREMGVTDPNDPEDNLRGGVKYLSWLTGLWSDEIQDESERMKFILASYNAGRGHVLDAQRLAEKNGADPQSWEDVAYWLLQKSKRSVYRDPVVQHGYVRGKEPVQYVRKILERYERYRNIDQ